jgi:HlyD family secretion protein
LRQEKGVPVKKLLMVGAVVVIVLGGYFGVSAVFTKSVDIPTAKVRRGELLIAQQVSGEVNAARAFTISAPRVRNLQITWMAPEGSHVKPGDPVIKFDATQQITDLNDQQSNLKIQQANLDRVQQEYTIQKKNLEIELLKAQRVYDEQKHEAPKMAEEARLQLELAQLNSSAKMQQLESDVQKANLEVQRAQDQVTMSERELAQLTINAPIPGMVVYLEIWKGSNMAKVQEGDSPWPGQGIINLPDLTDMVVEGTISEIDASKIDSGQEVIVSVDAIPDKKFNGTVLRKSTLAHQKDYNTKINVFDVTVAITDKDEQLKPGTSASCRVVVDRMADVVAVPLESVFEKDGKTVVFLESKKPIEVTVGRRSDMEVQIVSGLDGEETICLVDPTLKEQALPGDRATEPELNRGRRVPPPPGA